MRIIGERLSEMSPTFFHLRSGRHALFERILDLAQQVALDYYFQAFGFRLSAFGSVAFPLGSLV